MTINQLHTAISVLPSSATAKDLYSYVKYGVVYKTTYEVDMEEEWKDVFYALHPFSRSREGIWDDDVYCYFTPESYSEACADV